MNSLFDSARPDLQTAIRTLVLSGFQIENNERQPTHSEIHCHAPMLGASVPLMIVLTGLDQLPSDILPHVKTAAQRSNRTLIVIGGLSDDNQIGWADFLETLGGAVPSWRALDGSYLDKLEIAGRNARPDDFSGEAWRLFESLVGDGLEFCFGRRIRKLGAEKRGVRVSDMIAITPDEGVLVVDAKATSTSYNAAISELRALAEYTNNQRQRQKGFADVIGAVIVARGFDQDEPGLLQISREFSSQTGAPVAFLEVESLAHIVKRFKSQPNLRVGLKWRLLFEGGLLSKEMFDKEVKALRGERY